MFGCPSITAKFSGVCLAAMLCCTGCQFNGGATAPSSSSTTESSGNFPMGPMGQIFKQPQQDVLVNPYVEQQRQQEFTDDQTRPSVDMTRFKPKAKRSFSLFGN